MKDYRLVLGPAKGALILAGVSMAFALVMVFGLSHYYKARAVALEQSEKRLEDARSTTQTLTADLSSLEAHLPTFNHLVDIGLIGDPERDLWVRSLEALYNSLGLPPTLRYVLAPPQPLADNPEVSVGALPPLRTKALLHDLDIELSGLHEGEFLGFIDKLQTNWQAPFRIERCQMMRESEAGMQIKCTLRLFSLPSQQAGG